MFSVYLGFGAMFVVVWRAYSIRWVFVLGYLIGAAVVLLLLIVVLCNLANVWRTIDWICDVGDTIPEFGRRGFCVLNVGGEKQWFRV
jgi:hypothetical protein